MTSNLHPIAAIFNLCHTEKSTIASKSSLNQIKGNYQFDQDEIKMLSVQLFKGLQISRIIPEDRFTVKFNAANLKKIIDQGKSSNYVLLLLFSAISWLIEAERKKDISNFGLVLDVLDSVSLQIPIIYQVTNYFFISVFKLNADINYQTVEQQINRFCEKYKNNPNFIENTFMIWIQISYSFPVQTVFAQNILMFTAQFYRDNQRLFTEDQLNSLCFILNPKFSKLDRNALCFLIEIANILPLHSIYETTTYLIDSIQTVLEGTDIIYEIFDKKKYQKTFSFEKPRIISSSFQYPSKESFYSSHFLLPQFPFNPDFLISSTIRKMTNYISKILVSSSLPPNKFCSNLVDLLKNSLNSPHFFDYVASVLSILIFVESIQLDDIFKILINSPLFDPQITIFTKNSENEPVHKLRMLSYRYIVFPSIENCKLFFKKVKFPLLISEFFYYGVRMGINNEILKSHSFIHNVYITIIYYRQLDVNKNKTRKLVENKIEDSQSNEKDREVNDDDDDEDNDDLFNNDENLLFNEKQKNKNAQNLIEQTQSEKCQTGETNSLKNDANKETTQDQNENGTNRENTDVKKESLDDETNNEIVEDTIETLCNKANKENDDDKKENLDNENNKENTDDKKENIDNNENAEDKIETLGNEANKENDNDKKENLDNANNGNQITKQTNDSDKVTKSVTENIEEEEEDLGSENPENDEPKQEPETQTPKFGIPKVTHRKPLPKSKNNFIKWFLRAYRADCVAKPKDNSQEIELDDSVYFHCVLVYILVFIMKRIQSDEVSLIWNESAILPAIFSLIYDECLRPIILKILRIIWEVKISDTTFNSQSHILTIFQQDYDEEFALLDLQLLDAINTEMADFPHINRQSFTLLCPVITSILVNCDISSEFLHNAMKFFAFIPNEVKRATRTAIIAAMKRTEGDEPDRRFFTDFVLLITDEKNTTESPNYLIRMPKIVSIFIEAFIESPLRNEVFQFVDSLCRRSFANSFACHKGNVDLILLKFIKSYSDLNMNESESSSPRKTKEKERNINDILPALSLLYKIALRASSMPVVNTFISLFCPIKSNFVPPYISELTQTLRNIIIARQCQPIAYYPMSQDSPTVRILRLTGNHIKQGFTFVMTIYIDQFSQDYKPRILTISDKKQQLKVGISNRQISIYGISVPEVLFSCQIPLNTWTKVAISISPPKKIVECHIENQTPSVQPYHLNDFQSGIINCHFGGGTRSSPTVLHSINVCGFAIYPYIKDFNFKVFEFLNTTTLTTPSLSPLISVNFENQQSLLCIRKVACSDIDAILIGPNVILSLSLSDVLIRFFKAQILIPLFAQIDLPIYGTPNNEHLPPNFLASILNLLSSTLQLSIDCQQSFEQSSGFRIIAFLLTSNSPRNLTFDLYLHFVLIYESIHLPELKLQLFTYILTNAEIWALTPQKVCQQILDHWDQHLLTKYTDTFLSVLPFSKLINVFSHFYWRTARKAKKDESKTTEAKKVDSDSKNADANSILEYDTRTIIFRILCNVAEKQFTMSDLIALFMSCVGSPDIQFCEDLLLMIRLLAQSNHSPFRSLNNKDILFFTLHFLLFCYNEKIALSTIDTILVLHSCNLIQENVIDVFLHIEIIMTNIKEVFFTESFVTGLMKMSYSHPEILPFPFYIASICSKDNKQNSIITNIINDLHPSQDFGIGKLWFLWPLIAAIKFKDYTDFIMNFIILSSPGDWTCIYSAIEIIAKSLNNDPIPLQRAYLIDLGRSFLSGQRVPNLTSLNNQSNSSPLNLNLNNNNSISDDLPDAYNEIEEFVELCQYFIISKPVERTSLALQVAYAISPFIEGNELDIVSFDSMKPMTQSSTDSSSFKFFEGGEFFTNKIIELSQKTATQRKFALDLNEKGQWNDEKLSKTVIQVITKFNVDRFTSLSIALSPRQNNQIEIENSIEYRPNCDKLHELFESTTESIARLNAMVPSQASLIIENRRRAIAADSNLRAKYLDNIYNDIFIFINDEDRRVTTNRDESSKLWIHLWRQLTLDRAPWRNALPQQSTHFKRNRRILAYFAPVKLKRNMDFNEHKDASFNRDIGSGDLSKKRFEEHLNELEIQYRKEAPPPLLELKNEFSDQDENSSKSSISSTTSTSATATNNGAANSASTAAATTSGSFVIKLKEKSQQYKAMLLTLGGQREITFCLMRKKIQIIDNKLNKVKSIEASEVTHFLFRSFLHHEKSFEIITKNGKSYLIDLVQAASLDLLKIVSKLSSFEHALVQTVPFKEFVQSINIQSKWCNGYVSNFEYLMQLNFYGGRSFNELALYPVFPWIFSNYSSQTINLSDPSNFRDLSKPMGAQTPKRLNELLKHIKDFMAIRTSGFLYSSCYISPLTVILLLIRMEPFTTLHIQLQSGKFDHAARVFSSIPSAYRMATTHNNDFRELIPEFFYTSSFLENRNKFDLGKVNSVDVNDVILPKWSRSAIEFVYIHRKALESDYVSQHLNEWIDLIFGYKQKGQKAVEANNTFDPCLYENIWTKENLKDLPKRAMIEALLQHCGHIPNQLFNQPHPPKKKFTVKPLIDSSVSFTSGIFGSVFTSFYVHQKSAVRCIFLTEAGKIIIASTEPTNIAWMFVGLDSNSISSTTNSATSNSGSNNNSSMNNGSNNGGSNSNDNDAGSSISSASPSAQSNANAGPARTSSFNYRGTRRRTLILGKLEDFRATRTVSANNGTTNANDQAQLSISNANSNFEQISRRNSAGSFSFMRGSWCSSNASMAGASGGSGAINEADFEDADVDLSMTSPSKTESFAFYPKLSRFIVATDTGAVMIHDFNIGDPSDSSSGVKKESSVSLFQHIGRVNCVCVSENFIVSGGSDTIINVWENPNKPLSIALSRQPQNSSMAPSFVSAITPGSLSTPLPSNAAISINNSSNPSVPIQQPVGSISSSSVVSQQASVNSSSVAASSPGSSAVSAVVIGSGSNSVSNQQANSLTSNVSSTSQPANSPTSENSTSPSLPPSSATAQTAVKHLKSIQSFRSEITCIFVNEKFGTIAAGTKDGSVLLIDTASLISTVVIDIAPETPVKVHITPGWGFVIVYSTKVVEGRILNFISLFDIDGQFIRKKEITFNITAWTVYVSVDGFDFLVISNDTGGLFLCEAFFLDLEEAKIPKNCSKIVALKYVVSQGVLFATRENSVIEVYSSDVLNTKRFNRTVFGIEK